MKPADLARSGFFYLSISDHVQCAFCEGIVGYWDKGDDPNTEHKKHFPRCSLFQASPTGNVPLFPTSDTDNLKDVNKLLFEYFNYRLQYTKPPTPKPSKLHTGS